MYGNPDLNIDQLPTKDLALGNNALNNQVPNPFFGVANPNSYLGSQVMVPYNQLLRPFPEYTYLNLARSAPGASSQYDSLNEITRYVESFLGPDLFPVFPLKTLPGSALFGGA